MASAISRALGPGPKQRADALAAHAFVLAVGVTIPFSALMLIAGPLIYQAMGGRGAKLDLAIPIKGACALGFANHTDVGPYRIYEGAMSAEVTRNIRRSFVAATLPTHQEQPNDK